MPRAKATAQSAAKKTHAARNTAPAAVASVDELTPEELHALKAFATKRAEARRDRLQVGGGQPVDVTLRIRGALDVGVPTAADPEKLKPADVLAIVLAELGPKTRAKVREALVAKCDPWWEGGDEPTPEPEAKHAAEDLLQLAKREKKDGKKKGQVTGSLAVEVVSRGG